MLSICWRYAEDILGHMLDSNLIWHMLSICLTLLKQKPQHMLSIRARTPPASFCGSSVFDPPPLEVDPPPPDPCFVVHIRSLSVSSLTFISPHCQYHSQGPTSRESNAQGPLANATVIGRMEALSELDSDAVRYVIRFILKEVGESFLLYRGVDHTTQGACSERLFEAGGFLKVEMVQIRLW